MRAVVLITVVALSAATVGRAAADSGVAAQLADREAKLAQAVQARRAAMPTRWSTPGKRFA